jgi:lysozyme family protein
MKRKVRINKLPEGYHMMPDGTIMQDSAHKMQQGGSVKNLSPIDRNYANLEAERGELAMADLAGDGNMGLYAIGGERHSNGGTPLNLNPGSFIFSDTRKMKIKDPEFLAKYGKSKSVTPAKLAKPFLKLNDYTATLYDQDADDIQKRTANSMIKNYKNKTAEIAFYQESMKGFPQGIPAIAQEYAESVMGAAQMAYGGYVPKMEKGGPNVSSFLPVEYIKNLVDFEGGLSKDPRDNAAKTGKTSDGYHTNRGITYATYKSLAKKVLGVNPSEKHFKSLGPEDAVRFVNYYGESKGLNKIEDPALASLLHSFNWGSGTAMNKRVERALEKTLGTDISFENGKLTEQSINKLNNVGPNLQNAVFDNLLSERSKFYRGLEDYDVYGRGWERRLSSLKNLKNSGQLSQPGVNSEATPQSQAPSANAWKSSFETPGLFPPSIPRNYLPQVIPTPGTSGASAAPAQSYVAQSSVPQRSTVQVPAGPTSSDPNRLSVYSPEELEFYKTAQGTPGYEYLAGLTAFAGDASRPAMQRSRPDKSYGEENITSAEALADLKRRQPWIFEEKPDWKFSNPEDVKWAQNTYEQRRKKFAEDNNIKYIPYFRSKSEAGYRPGEGFDSKFGEHTFNMPALAISSPAEQPQTTPETTPPAETRSQDPNFENPSYESDSSKAVPFEQDVRNYLTSLRNRASERRRFAWTPQLGFMPADPTYMDDTRQQGQIAGAARSMANAIGAFAGPQALGSRMSQIAGQAGEQSADIAARLQAGNTGIANQFETYNSELANEMNLRNIANQIQGYDKNIKTLESYDEAMRQYNTEAAQLKNNLVTNAYRAKAMNKMNPLFQITPDAGRNYNTGNIEFMPGVSAATFDPNNYTPNSERMNNDLDNMMEQIKNSTLSPEDQSAAMKTLFEKKIGQMYPERTKSSASDAATNFFDFFKYMGNTPR